MSEVMLVSSWSYTNINRKLLPNEKFKQIERDFRCTYLLRRAYWRDTTVNGNVCCYCSCGLLYSFVSFRSLFHLLKLLPLIFHCTWREICALQHFSRGRRALKPLRSTTTCQSCRQAPIQQQLAAYSLKELEKKSQLKSESGKENVNDVDILCWFWLG